MSLVKVARWRKKLEQEQTIENAKRGIVGGSISGAVHSGLQSGTARARVIKALKGAAIGGSAGGSGAAGATIYANRKALKQFEEAKK